MQAFQFKPRAGAILLHPAGPQPPQQPVPATPVYLAKNTNLMTVNPAALQLQNPQFRPPVALLHAREEFDLPTVIAPSVEVDDQTIFESPKPPLQKFALTHYDIAAAAGSGARRVTFGAVAQGYQLRVDLADTTPPALLQGATRLEPAVRFLISASLNGRSVAWDLASASPSAGAALSLTLDLHTAADRDLLYSAMTDPASGARLIIRRSLNVAVPVAGTPPQRYSAGARSIDSSIPFLFNKDLDKEIFSGLQGVQAAAQGWNMVAVNWNGRSHRYYQSMAQPTQVYFLPDAFKVERSPTPPHPPALSVTASGADAASLQMTLSYLASPIWDPQRVADAATRLKQTLNLSAPPDLALFQATNTKLLLNLPATDDAVGATLVEQPSALIDVTAGVQGSVTLPLVKFRDLYDALFDPQSALLSGEVCVTVDSDVTTLPFVVRVADMTSDILAIDSAADTHGNRLVVTLRNAIESPIHIKALAGVIARGDQLLPSTIKHVAPALPADLKPASAGGDDAPLLLTIEPNAMSVIADSVSGILGGVFGGGGNTGRQVVGAVGGAVGGISQGVVDPSCKPLLDLSQVTVAPDPKAIWAAITRDRPIGAVSRKVTLKLVAATLAKPDPGAPSASPQIVAVQVVFESGQTVTFDASQAPDAAGLISQTLVLSAPLESFVLGAGRTDVYTYRVDVVTVQGLKQGEWTTDNRDTLFIVPTP